MYALSPTRRTLSSFARIVPHLWTLPCSGYTTVRQAALKKRILPAVMSDSPPPTPPSRPVKDDELRFKKITSPCEWAEDYRPGGYHPVLLGDIFNDGQYKAIRKLGEGSYSTVWLALDLR